MKSSKKALVIGGTSGLGLAFAQALSNDGNTVFVTGRNDPKKEKVTFLNLTIGDDPQPLMAALDDIVDAVQEIDLLIYAAGFFQHGTIGQLDDQAILTMINVGLSAPSLLVQRILRAQHRIPEVILITSTSQEIPRLYEPVYAAVKAGLAMLGNSLALDARIGKTMVVAPSGMDTNMWKGEMRSGVLLDPKWVAHAVLDQFQDEFTYQFIRVLRDPARVMSVEKR